MPTGRQQALVPDSVALPLVALQGDRLVRPRTGRSAGETTSFTCPEWMLVQRPGNNS